MELPFKSPEFGQAWEEWIQYRNERKLPKYVPTGLKRTFSMLVRISGNNEQIAISIINQSIELNYQGLFPLKNIQQNASGKAQSRIDEVKARMSGN